MVLLQLATVSANTIYVPPEQASISSAILQDNSNC